MFSHLDEADLCLIAEHSHFRFIEKKQLVFQEGDSPDGGHVVSLGRIILKKQAKNKKPVVAELLGRGDPFGVVCAAKGEPYPLSAEAVRESVILSVGQEFLVSLASNNTKFAGHLFDLCRTRFHTAQEKFAHLVHSDSRARVASAMLLFAEKFSSEEEGVLDITREELSHIAGVTVETCIRVTRKLEDQGSVAFPGAGKIKILDQSELRVLANYTGRH